MSFDLAQALAYLRCPISGEPLALVDDELVSTSGHRYPVVDGIPDLTAEAQRYDGSTSDYDAIAGIRYNAFLLNPLTMSFTWGLGVLRAPLLMNPTKILAGGVFLDVPCGTGIFTARGYRHNPATKIIAADYSMGMLRVARSRAQRRGIKNAIYIRADVARLPLANNVLDGCLSMAGLHAFQNPAAAAKQIARVLKPDASVTASVATSGVRRISDFMIEKVMKPMGYFEQKLPESAYCQMFRDAGFADVSSHMAGAVAIIHATRGK